ncbi:hypothetical protein ACFVU2_01085 [Leifsonia sp. NPDC058194]|uniref:hypothetical protein n=1 Tax=Leifsonia sp. NPDC058194 TaxID=3346374 RepID=UPI0036D7DC88
MYHAGPIGGGLTVGGVLAATGSGSMMTVIGVTIVSLFLLLGGLLLLRAASHRRQDRAEIAPIAGARHSMGGRHVG